MGDLHLNMSVMYTPTSGAGTAGTCYKKSFIKNTLQPHYNAPHYDAVFIITRPCHRDLWNLEADLEGVQGVCSNPLLEPNYLISMGNFKKCCVKLGKRTPLLYI